MTATLNDYMKSTQRLIRDPRQTLINPADLINYINEGRREIAMRAQCIRRLTPVSGQVTAVSVTTPGSGYTAPTATITAPDFPSGTGLYPDGAQATVTATQIGGTIAGINVDFGGAGYYQPQVIINDPTGIGAEATATVSGINQLNQAQEVYPFSMVDLSLFPGIASIYMIKSVSIIYSNYRYSLPCVSFSEYQAKVRTFPFQYQYVPAICSQYGIGDGGSFYLYPLPSQAYQLEWDCFCLPQDLETALSVEALPAPFTDAVQFYSAYKCFMELQNYNAARSMKDQLDEFIHRYASYTQPGRRINPYGRV